jgi:hypothetical protein
VDDLTNEVIPWIGEEIATKNGIYFKIILYKKDRLIPRKFSLEMQLQTFRMPKIIIRQLRKDGFKGKQIKRYGYYLR